MTVWIIVMGIFLVACVLVTFAVGYLVGFSVAFEQQRAEREVARQNQAAAQSSPEELRMLLGTWDRGEERRRDNNNWWIQPERRAKRDRRIPAESGINRGYSS